MSKRTIKQLFQFNIGEIKMGKNSNFFSSNDVSKLEKFSNLSKSASGIAEKLQNKNLLLVLGQTGSGKSTLINHLLGHPMVRHEDGHLVLSEEVNGEKATIGQTYASQTLHPEVYSCGKSYQLCDTAGFSDTRGDQVSVASYLAMQTIGHAVSKIQGLLIVIDYNAFKNGAGRGQSLRETLSTVASTFKAYPDIINSALLVINKTELTQSSKEVLNRAQVIQELQRFKDANLNWPLIEQFISNPTHIVIPDLLDRVNSKNRLFTSVDQLTSVDGKMIQSDPTHPSVAILREQVSDVASQAMQWHIEHTQLNERFQHASAEIISKRNQIQQQKNLATHAEQTIQASNQVVVLAEQAKETAQVKLQAVIEKLELVQAALNQKRDTLGQCEAELKVAEGKRQQVEERWWNWGWNSRWVTHYHPSEAPARQARNAAKTAFDEQQQTFTQIDAEKNLAQQALDAANERLIQVRQLRDISNEPQLEIQKQASRALNQLNSEIQTLESSMPEISERLSTIEKLQAQHQSLFAKAIDVARIVHFADTNKIIRDFIEQFSNFEKAEPNVPSFS